MIDVKRVFPNCLGEEGYFDVPEYPEIIKQFGEIEIQSSNSDFQGCFYFLLKKDKQYGYLSVSYGSCSGCDLLLACVSYHQLQELVDRLESSIIWHDSFEDMQKWISQRDWETQIEWHTGILHFLKEFREYPLRAFK